MTLDAIMRLMPATPMADNKPPMVVGMRQTSSATSTVIVTGAPSLATATLNSENGNKVAVASKNTRVKAISRIVSAISFGVFCRLAPFDHGDHAIDEGFAGIHGNAHHQPVRQHARAAGDG